jgi:hypothetical protein
LTSFRKIDKGVLNSLKGKGARPNKV